MEFKKPKKKFHVLSRDFVKNKMHLVVFFLVISKNNDWLGIKIILISHSQFFFIF